VAIPCFEAGKHVTIEKPLALTMRAGKLMLDAAQKAPGRCVLGINDEGALQDIFGLAKFAALKRIPS
jgi:hypothetical protein